jgi:hypothetical protein
MDEEFNACVNVLVFRKAIRECEGEEWSISEDDEDTSVLMVKFSDGEPPVLA